MKDSSHLDIIGLEFLQGFPFESEVFEGVLKATVAKEEYLTFIGILPKASLVPVEGAFAFETAGKGHQEPSFEGFELGTYDNFFGDTQYASPR